MTATFFNLSVLRAIFHITDLIFVLQYCALMTLSKRIVLYCVLKNVGWGLVFSRKRGVSKF